MNLTFSKIYGGDLISLNYNGTEYLDQTNSASINIFECSNGITRVVPMDYINYTSNQINSEIKVLELGPLFGKLEIKNNISGFEFIRTIIIYWNDSFVDFKIKLRSNQPEAALVTQRIPLNIENSTVRLGSQYGSHVPQGWKEKLTVNLPAMYWATVYNDSVGLGLVDYGLISKRIFNDSIYLDLYHKSATEAEPDNTKVYRENKEVTLNFAIFPYMNNISQVYTEIHQPIYLNGYEYNFPIYYLLSSNHTGLLPKNFSLLTINDSRILLTRLNEINGNISLRLVNADIKNNISFSLKFADEIHENFLD
ncbi:MAG: hypothetical protein GF329_09170 [Candidatus Lokiarchaeota archaeon]|nr:hypothetical protein [Candidatus Lokiarchaeota archaeon]